MRASRTLPPRWLAAAALMLVALSGLRAAPLNLDAYDAQKKTVTLPNGQVLAYVDIGNPAGDTLVLIHGFTDNARDWVPLLPYLPKDKRLLAVDIRGHGRSGKPECCYSRFDFAYDIKLLLDALGIAKADVIGHSLGSIITQTLAEFWPERVRSAVLISSTAGPRAGAPAPAPPFDFAADIRKLKEPIDPDSAFMIRWWDSPTPVDADFIRRQRKDAAAIPLRVWLAVIDQGLSLNDLQATLPRLAAPTLLIWGEKDPIIAQDARQTLREALPAAKVRIFPALGHNPFWEDPRGVADEIIGFINARQ